MAEHNVAIRLSLKDAETIKKALEAIGQEGSKALKVIEKAAEPASSGLKSLNTISENVKDRLGELSGRAGLVGDVLRNISPAGLAAAAGIGTLVIAVHKGIDAFLEMERANIRLEAVLKATNYAAGLGAQELAEYAETLERHSQFAAEQIADSTSAMLTFKNITGETFLRAQKLAADLASALKRDLSEATLQLGRVLENPIEGLDRLDKKYQLFNTTQSEAIKKLAETGNIAAAQEAILTAFESKVGGVAEALGTQGLTGALHQTGVAAGDFFKEIGKIVTQGGVLEGVIRTIGNRIDDVTAALHAGNEVLREWIIKFDTGVIGIASKLGLIDKEIAQFAADEAMDRLSNSTRNSGEAAAIAAGKIAKQKEAEAAHKQAIDATLSSLEKERALNGLSIRDKEIQQKLTKTLDDLHKQGIQTSAQETASLKAKITAVYDSANAQKQNSNSQEQYVQSVKEFIKQNSLAADNFGKTTEQIKLQQVQTIKASSSYGLLNEQLKKQLTLTEEQLKKAVILEDQKKKQKEVNDLLKDFNLIGNEQATVLAADRIEIFKQSEAYQKLSEATKKQIDLIQQQVKNPPRIKQETSDREAATEALKRFNKEYEETIKNASQPFIEGARNIQNGLADAIKSGMQNGFGRGKNILQNFGNVLKDTFYTGISQGIAAALTSQYVNPLVSSFANFINPTIGSSVSTQLGVNSGTAGIGGGFNPLSLFSAGKSAYSLFSGGLQTAGGFNALNQFGASYLGTGLPGLSGGLTATSLSGLLGGAGIGALGGGLLAGLTGGNQLGGSIGGSIGGAIGTAILPGVGTVIGSALGGLVGGLFGGGKKTVASEFAGNVTGNNLGNLSYGSKGTSTDAAKSLAQGLGTLISSLGALGINFSDSAVRGGTNSKRGNTFSILGAGGDVLKQIGFDPGNADSVSQAIAQVAIELAKAGKNSDSLSTALQHIQTEGRKTEEIINDLSFAAAFDKLGEVNEPVSQFKTQIDALNKQFDEARKTADRLGLSIEKVNQYQAQAITALQVGFAQGLTSEILQITDPLAAQIVAENARYQQQLKDAKVLGASLTQVEQLHYLKMQQIAQQAGYMAANDNAARQEEIERQESFRSALEEQARSAQDLVKRYQAISASFAKTLNSLKVSDLSTLSPAAKLAEARSQFERLSASAKLGDADSMEQLEDAARTFLETSRDFNASSGAYSDDFAHVQDILSQVKGVADRQTPIQQQIYGAATAQLTQLQTISGQIAGMNQGITDLSKNLLNAYFNSGNANKAAGSVGGGYNVGSLAGMFPDSNLVGRGASLSVLDGMSGSGLTVRQNRIIARLAGYTGEFDNGIWANYAKTHPDLAAQYNQLVVAYGGRPVQFASGGLTPANQFFSVGERGPELMFSGNRSAVFSAEQSRKLLDRSTGDNSQMIAELRDIKQALQALIHVTAASGDMNNDGLSAIESRLSTIERKARLEAAA